MNILTANVAEMLQAVRDLLKDYQGIQDIGAKVDLAEPSNDDPSRCPLIQIFPVRSSFASRALGMGAGYRAQDNEFFVQFQQTHANDGDACFALLGELVQAGTSAMLTDPTLKGTVLTIGDFAVEFPGVLKTNDAIMQTAILRVVGQTTVSGG
jgi:hypothetical protein